MPLLKAGTALVYDHPGEERLLRAVQRGWLDTRSWGVCAHLLLCASCRQSAAQAEAGLLHLAKFHQRRPLPSSCRDQEASRQRLLMSMRHAANEAEQSGWRLSLRPSEAGARPLLIAAALAAGCILVMLLTPHRAAPGKLSAEAVLARASAVEAATREDREPGVLFQRISVRSGERAFHWQVYRDRESRRSPRFGAPTSQEAILLRRMKAAGVSRSDPLSVAAFNQWRRGLAHRVDVVVEPAAGLLKVETSAPSGSTDAVREESLTLRRGDYHPLARTIVFRDEQTVELAEVEYRVMAWSQAGKDWFAPPAGAAPAPAVHPTVTLRAAQPLSESQLDLAELEARIALSRTNAEESEQIDVARTPAGIVVSGLAGSSARKQQLQAALDGILHVTTRLQTPEDLDHAAVTASRASSPAPTLKLEEDVSQPSPLVRYWQQLHRTPASADELSVKLLDCVLRIRQQTHLLEGLSRQFPERSSLDAEARRALDVLVRDHEDKLQAALSEGVKLMGEFPSTDAGADRAHVASGSMWEQMEGSAERQMECVRQLTSSQGAARGDAPLLSAELRQGFEELGGLLARARTSDASAMRMGNAAAADETTVNYRR